MAYLLYITRLGGLKGVTIVEYAYIPYTWSVWDRAWWLSILYSFVWSLFTPQFLTGDHDSTVEDHL